MFRRALESASAQPRTDRARFAKIAVETLIPIFLIHHPMRAPRCSFCRFRAAVQAELLHRVQDRPHRSRNRCAGRLRILAGIMNSEICTEVAGSSGSDSLSPGPPQAPMPNFPALVSRSAYPLQTHAIWLTDFLSSSQFSGRDDQPLIF